MIAYNDDGQNNEKLCNMSFNIQVHIVRHGRMLKSTVWTITSQLYGSTTVVMAIYGLH